MQRLEVLLSSLYPLCQVWQQVPLLLLSHFASPTNSCNFVGCFLFCWIGVPYFLPFNYQGYANFLCYMMDFFLVLLYVAIPLKKCSPHCSLLVETVSFSLGSGFFLCLLQCFSVV